jgi:hypothetical protein
LAKILPIESADMYYSKYDTIHANTLYNPCDIQDFNIREYTPCWSLAALLNAIPQIKIRGSKKIGYIVYYNKNIASNRSFNIVDACYEMLLKLHKQKLL